MCDMWSLDYTAVGIARSDLEGVWARAPPETFSILAALRVNLVHFRKNFAESTVFVYNYVITYEQ